MKATSAMRRGSRPHVLRSTCVLLLGVLCCFNLWSPSAFAASVSSNSAVDTAPPLEEPPPPPQLSGHLHEQLETLAGELQKRTQRAERERDTLQERMNSSKQLITSLFANEREETELFVQETRFKMQALRDVMRVEMQRALQNVQQQMQSAVENVTALVQQREKVKREKEQKLRLLLQQKQEAVEEQRRQQQEEQERLEQEQEERERQLAESRKSDAADAGPTNEGSEENASTSVGEINQSPSPTVSSNNASSSIENFTTRSIEAASGGATDSPLSSLLGSTASTLSRLYANIWWLFRNVLVPLVLVLGGLLLVLIALAKYEVYRRRAKRTRGVIYSGYLKRSSEAERRQRRRRAATVVGTGGGNAAQGQEPTRRRLKSSVAAATSSSSTLRRDDT